MKNGIERRYYALSAGKVYAFGSRETRDAYLRAHGGVAVGQREAEREAGRMARERGDDYAGRAGRLALRRLSLTA